MRGLSILWSIFLLALLAEAFNAAFYLLAGKVSWPPASHLVFGSVDVGALPLETIRLAMICTLFIGLWAGWGWLRWLLGVAAFLAGALLLVQVIQSYHAAPKFRKTGIADAPVFSSIESLPKTALGILYLLMAGYVVFSYDVVEFVNHRRTRGRIWSALLVTVIVYPCMLLILGAQPIYNFWLQKQRASALAFGEDTLRTMSDQWAGNCIDDRIDREFGKQFTPDGRKSTFANFKDLGHLTAANPVPPMVITSVKPDPLQNIVPAPADISTQVTKDESGFQMNARYSTTGATFEHGEVKFGFDLVRDLFGPWRIRGLDAVPIRIDRPHKAAPTPSPDASPVPGAPNDPAASPAPSAMPGPTTSTAPTDAAAPTPAATPVPSPAVAPGVSPAASVVPPATPAAPVAPPPAASTAPAAIPTATPAPSTGG